MNPWIPFLTALIWPLTIGVLLTSYRRDVSTLIRLVQRRLERGDRVSWGGLALEPPNRDLGLPSVLTPDATSPEDESVARVTAASVRGKVLIATGADDQGVPSGFVGAGDALGVAVLQAAFAASPGVKVQAAVIRHSYAYVAQLVRDNYVFISVGGPYSNQLTRFVMQQVRTTLTFEGPALVDRLRRKEYTPTIDDRTLSGSDWGLILSLPHPQYGAEGRAVIVAGCRDFGSQGAAMVLAKLHEHKELLALAQGGLFEGLIEVPTKNGQIETPKVVECRRFDVESTSVGAA